MLNVYEKMNKRWPKASLV